VVGEEEEVEVVVVVRAVLAGRLVRRGGRAGSSLAVVPWVVLSRREGGGVGVDVDVAIGEDALRRWLTALKRRCGGLASLSLMTYVGSTASTCLLITSLCRCTTKGQSAESSLVVHHHLMLHAPQPGGSQAGTIPISLRNRLRIIILILLTLCRISRPPSIPEIVRMWSYVLRCWVTRKSNVIADQLQSNYTVVILITGSLNTK
jgi:hypothetical protein